MKFSAPSRKTPARDAFVILELIFHATVHNVRKGQGNAIVGMVTTIAQSAALVAIFYLIFEVMGLRGLKIRGDYIIYILSGIFVFMTHVKTVGAVAGAEGAVSAIMKHSPMNTTISICAAALSALYQQVLAVAVMLFSYHALIHPLEIDQPVATFAMLLLAWFTGAAIGMVFMAFKPWAPALVSLVNKGYVRISMIASGKMFVANMLPGQMRALFDWHPLFHIVDQTRGFAFINYSPHFTQVGYPLRIALVCLAIGLLGEFYTRKRVSLSWNARGLGQ